MPIHHIIPKHEWKERFGTLRGCNADDNLVCLTQEQHIQVHKLLYEQFGRLSDKMAVNMMEGTITHKEMVSEWRKKGGRTAILTLNKLPRGPLSEEHKRKISQSKLGMKYSPHRPGGKPRNRKPLSDKTKILIAQKKREWWDAKRKKEIL